MRSAQVKVNLGIARLILQGLQTARTAADSKPRNPKPASVGPSCDRVGSQKTQHQTLLVQLQLTRTQRSAWEASTCSRCRSDT